MWLLFNRIIINDTCTVEKNDGLNSLSLLGLLNFMCNGGSVSSFIPDLCKIVSSRICIMCTLTHDGHTSYVVDPYHIKWHPLLLLHIHTLFILLRTV